MLALMLAAQIAAAPSPLIATPAACELRRQILRARPGEVRAQRLAEMPRARHEIAVQRTVAGCPVPVIVRYDVEAR